MTDIDSSWATQVMKYDHLHWMMLFLNAVTHTTTTQLYRYFARIVSKCLYALLWDPIKKETDW